MDDTRRAPEQIIKMLAEGPSLIAALTADRPAAQVLVSPAPGEWSAREVLAHLRACADMWGRCIVVILREDNPTIKAVNPTTWIKQTNYLEMEFHPSLQAFTDQRAELLAVLRPLPHEAWSRKAIVTGAGKPIERSVYRYAEWLASHERPHLKQIERIVQALVD